MGKQVYISDKCHKKLKLASMLRDENMGAIVEGFIEDMEVDGWKEIAESPAN